MVVRGRNAAYALSGVTEGAAVITEDAFQESVEEAWFAAKVDRKAFKALLKRSDLAAMRNFGLWLVLLAASGYAGFLSWGTWWAVPAFFVYGTLYTSSGARWHECSHGTPFRSRWLNEVFYNLVSFMAMNEAYQGRWSHSRHHTDTIIVGRDPEIQVSRPADLARIALDFFNLFIGYGDLKKIFTHALGRLTSDTSNFVPNSERNRMIWLSRLYLLVFVSFVAWAAAIHSFLPLMYVWFPRFYCGWHLQMCTLMQHAGLAENVRDHRLNTRTVLMNPVNRFLYLNMNYHIEHHMFPMVPYYNLPKLHELIKDQCPPPYNGVLAAYREIVPALLEQARNSSYFVKREVPESRPPSRAQVA
jgi:fatty acid desaturase